MSAFSIRVGRYYWFEYHCNESFDSPDATIWLRSHQRVQVLAIVEPGCGRTFQQRTEAGAPRMFKVRWEDGLVWDVFEDELMPDRKYFCRPHPPRASCRLSRR